MREKPQVMRKKGKLERKDMSEEETGRRTVRTIIETGKMNG